MPSEFRNLVVYKHAVELADELYAVVERWPSFDRWSSGLQLMRAVDSIGANIAEGSGRWHRPDQKRFLSIARGSLSETEHWVARAQARNLADDRFDARLAETARALNGLMRKWGSS